MNLMKYFESAIYRLSIHRFLERESEIENKREREEREKKEKIIREGMQGEKGGRKRWKKENQIKGEGG